MPSPVDDLLASAAVYYGSSLGHVEHAAQRVASHLGIPESFDLYDRSLAGAARRRFVVLAMSTWYDGILQDQWLDRQGELSEIDWHSTIVAMLCLGDQYGYPRTFADALGIVWDAIEPRGATLVGRWAPESDPAGYDFRASRGLRSGRFLGLVLDEDNQSDATEQRITLWCEQVRRELTDLIEP